LRGLRLAATHAQADTVLACRVYRRLARLRVDVLLCVTRGIWVNIFGGSVGRPSVATGRVGRHTDPAQVAVEPVHGEHFSHLRRPGDGECTRHVGGCLESPAAEIAGTQSHVQRLRRTGEQHRDYRHSPLWWLAVARSRPAAAISDKPSQRASTPSSPARCCRGSPRYAECRLRLQESMSRRSL
jgi:hypothetical protein